MSTERNPFVVTEKTLRRAIGDIVSASDANDGAALSNAINSARDLALRSYSIELTKTIVVTFEACTPEEAIELATDPQEGYDGAWDRAEVHATTLSEGD